MLDGLSYAWDPLAGAYFAAAAMVFIAGGGVVLYERFTEASRRFFLLTGITAGWVTTLGLAVLAWDPAVEALWLRVTWVIDPFTAPAMFWLVQALVGVRRRGVQYGAWAVGAVFSVIGAQGPWLVQGLETATRELRLTDLGWLGALYFLYVSVLAVLAVRAMVRSTLATIRPVERLERGILLAGILVGLLTLVDYWIPAATYRAGPLTPWALMAAALIGGWVAVRYRVFSVTRTFGTDEVLEAMSDAVLMLDATGRIRGANRAASELLGLDEPKLLGRPVHEFLREPDNGNGGWQPEPGERFRDRELVVRYAPGALIEVSVAAEPLTTRGRVLGTVVVARDIRDRLEAERELEVQRRYFAELFENIPEAIALVDEEDRVLLVNGAFTGLFGYTQEEAEGETIEALIVPEGRRPEGKRMADRAAAGESIMVETVRRRKDGSTVDVSLLGHALDLPGRPVQVYGIYRDISDRKRAERQLKEREEELRHSQKMEAVGTLAGGIAHDFNNLMTVINGHARFALDDLSDTGQVRRDLEEIERAGKRAATLTQQLLAFGRRQVLRPRLLDLNEVVRETERMLGRLIGEHIRLELDLSETARVRADRSQLEQVVVNLTVNARDAMPEGGTLTLATDAVTLAADHPVVEASEMTPGPCVRLTVADTGVGMDPATLDQIFDPFFTTKDPGKGTGLGLSTVFGIVKQSGGHVVAESEPGTGTRIEIYLPHGEDADGADVSATEPEEESGERDVDQTVLVVEDEAGVRQLVARVLEREGFAVLTAADGEEGLRILRDRAGNVALVLTDIVMPKMGGHELAEHVRREWPSLPILFMSGYDDEVVADGRDAFALLAKPFTPAMLAERVTETLAARA